eukprot:4141968-Pyramimonas_sp.AAC.1
MCCRSTNGAHLNPPSSADPGFRYVGTVHSADGGSVNADVVSTTLLQCILPVSIRLKPHASTGGTSATRRTLRTVCGSFCGS